ncbi:hypothetical protein HN011_003297 [Eciton burchellii]|nr:hypothetical protein HN011_003297 [Eciton burchellii]
MLNASAETELKVTKKSKVTRVSANYKISKVISIFFRSQLQHREFGFPLNARTRYTCSRDTPTAQNQWRRLCHAGRCVSRVAENLRGRISLENANEKRGKDYTSNTSSCACQNHDDSMRINRL